MVNITLMNEIAIIGATASGKSDVALSLAAKQNGVILSLDSLSLYKEVDIASAKPTVEERGEIEHFGIDIINPDEPFNAAMFMDEYDKAKEYAKKSGKNLIIVGGSSFYLKSMIEGLTDMPSIGEKSRERAKAMTDVLEDAYKYLQKIDPAFADSISATDKYRISRGLEIFFETGDAPSDVFSSMPKKKIDGDIKILEIAVDRDVLRGRIRRRVEKMFEAGIIGEAEHIASKYGSEIKPMKSIGLKEVYGLLEGEYGIENCKELITIHTSQLAKRQTTFNKTQINADMRGSAEEVLSAALSLIST